MTKEECITKCFKEGDQVHISLERCERAMSLWAQTQAIAFERWKSEQGYIIHDNKFYHNEPPAAGKQTFFTLEELYNLFIQSQVKP